MPLPGSRVIPANWSQHHRPTAAAAFTAECVITRPTGAGSTASDGTWTPSPDDTIYSGGCRAVPLSTDQGRVRVSGEAQQTPRRYHIGIEHDADRVLIGDVVMFTQAQDDRLAAGLVGLKFRVADIRYGSEQWQRDLLAEEIQ